MVFLFSDGKVMGLRVPKIEKLMGIEVYATHSLGIGGVIREFVEDFVVEEVLIDDAMAKIRQQHVEGQDFKPSINERYLLCVLVKRNWDTFEALKAVARQLNIRLRQMHIAGIKDAKAVTAQHITIEGVSPEDVKKVNVKDIEIRPVGFFRHKLSSYYLLGNSFNITVRAIQHSKSTIQRRINETIKGLEELGGLPNFFGHQRFGTTRPITHLVGKAIVKGDLRKAVMLFLAKPSLKENPESRQAREQLWKSQDFQKALKNFPRQLRYERLMLRHLAKKPDDFVGAFKTLPVKLQMLFPQAYQAYLFNKFLSRRIAGGLPLNRAEVGDYVVHVQRSGLPLLTMYKIVKSETLTEVNEALRNGRMCLALPLIGFKQKLSQGFQGEVERQILEGEGITPENFKIHFMPAISSKGGLRTALTQLINFQLTDVSADSVKPRKNKAKLSFMLPKGSYATILLRELMKSRNPAKTGF
ncbi:MAG: tRNA pseudouridine(13) synthase TruD [Candidatus Bathyarchaeia archaeon]